MAYLACCKGITAYGVKIPVSEIIAAAANTNEYLVRLDTLFTEIGFNLFTVLGQRNISGVIGEIYSQFLAAGNEFLVNNPHPDGRPDVLCVTNKEVSDYLDTCFITIGDKRLPLKSMLAPFKYGGVEVKCTIGDPVSDYKVRLRKEHRIDDFYIGFPRVDFLSNLNWWAHHTKSSHLLGLYYDFSEEYGGLPQVMAGFFGVLTADNWTKVSTGKVENKKTSNTSLNKTGKEIMKSQPVFVVDNKRYIEALRHIGVKI